MKLIASVDLFELIAMGCILVFVTVFAIVETIIKIKRTKEEQNTNKNDK